MVFYYCPPLNNMRIFNLLRVSNYCVHYTSLRCEESDKLYTDTDSMNTLNVLFWGLLLQSRPYSTTICFIWDTVVCSQDSFTWFVSVHIQQHHREKVKNSAKNYSCSFINNHSSCSKYDSCCNLHTNTFLCIMSSLLSAITDSLSKSKSLSFSISI